MKFIVELLAYGKDGEVREVNLEWIRPETKTETILGAIFNEGQNDHHPKEQPSVSVGDVIRLGEDRYLVLPVGFKKLSQADYERYKAIPQNHRAVRCYLDNAMLPR